jgi:hypothetical protein
VSGNQVEFDTRQGQGLGQMLFANALKRTLAVAEEIGIYAMVVDAISKEAECFYTQYGGTISRFRGVRFAHLMFSP